MTYWIYKDHAGEWRWYLKAANGDKLADSGEGYRNKSDCELVGMYVRSIKE